MNRVIKFRAWHKQEMLPPVTLQEMLEFASESKDVDISSADIMQFTGLTDKNGVTCIYEGDIIDSDGLVIGNIYESPSLHGIGVNHTIERLGTEEWRGSESIAVGRGCKYTKLRTS